MDTIIIVLLTIIIIILLQWKRRIVNGPPGPTPLPIIGNLHLIDRDAPQTMFHNLYLKYGNIYSLYMGSVYTVVLNEIDIIQDALINNSDSFSDRYITDLSTIVGKRKDVGFSNGDVWKKSRDIWSAAMTRSKVLQIESILISNINNCLNSIEEESKINNTINLKLYIKKIAFNSVFKLLFSKEVSYGNGESGLEDLIHATGEVAKYLANGNPGDFIPILKPFSNFTNIQMEMDCVDKYLIKFIKEHKDTINRENPRDFMDTLIIESEKDTEGILDDLCVLKNASDFIIAGNDTTASSLDWCMIYLANYPEYQELIFNEISIFERNPTNDLKFSNLRNSLTITQYFIKEVWRVRPTLPLSVPHKVSKDINFHNYFIPKDTLIFTNFYSASLSTKTWKDPHEFNPMRYLDKEENSQPNLVFGFGLRKCVGLNLAEVNILLVIVYLVKRFKISRVSNEMIDNKILVGLTSDTLPYNVKVTLR